MLELGLLVAGIVISTIVMAIGIGGGILWTPLLILVYGLSPQEAISTALLIQVIGMGSGSIAYIRAKMVETKLAIIFFLVALPGVVIGSYVTFNLPEHFVQMALGIMAMLLAMLFVSTSEEFESQGTFRFNQKQVNHILPIPAFFGFIMGFLSLGISEWLIPALRSRLKLEMGRAIATIVPVMFLLACVASTVHFSIDSSLNLNYFIWGSIGTIIGSQLGVHISKRINERILKQSFIYLMTLIGIHLIFQSV